VVVRLFALINKYHLLATNFIRFLSNGMISETFYLLNLIAKLSPILLLYLWWVSPLVNKRNQT